MVTLRNGRPPHLAPPPLMPIPPPPSFRVPCPQVEGAPQVVKAGLKKDEAEALQKTLVEGELRRAMQLRSRWCGCRTAPFHPPVYTHVPCAPSSPLLQLAPRCPWNERRRSQLHSIECPPTSSIGSGPLQQQQNQQQPLVTPPFSRHRWLLHVARFIHFFVASLLRISAAARLLIAPLQA